MANTGGLPTTVGELLATARRRLGAAPFAPLPREAALLLGRVIGLSEAQLMARPEAVVPDAERAAFGELLARRLAGEPVAYLFGVREFYGRDFAVDRRVLIPRPETEHLIATALTLELPPRPRILDVGTGSGCLAITLALELSGARVVAIDLSLGALAVAAGNRRRYRLEERVALVAADLVSAIDLPAFDLVVSNPPYVGRSQAAALSPEIRDFEPALALFAEDDGEAAFAALIAAGERLRPGAHLLLEIGHDQLAAVERRVAASALHLAATWRDYSGTQRVAHLRRPD